MIFAATLCLAAVHDGDTIRTCDGVKVRLVAEAGPMDAPELPNSPRYRAEQLPAALAARDRLREILSKPAEIRCIGVDKYRRSLCLITVRGSDVGDQMVREGHAVLRPEWRGLGYEAR